jgi:hypothetical protein
MTLKVSTPIEYWSLGWPVAVEALLMLASSGTPNAQESMVFVRPMQYLSEMGMLIYYVVL